MARVLTCFFRQISWAYGIHVEGLFPVYRGKVLPRDDYPLGWVSCTWEIPTSVSFYSVAIHTQFRVPETNSILCYQISLHLCCTSNKTSYTEHSTYIFRRSIIDSKINHFYPLDWFFNMMPTTCSISTTVTCITWQPFSDNLLLLMWCGTKYIPPYR